MGELSFLTIIVSLAVCSILVFAVYQYMKVRFTILEHSQKEQALILQQYIEESSYDIQGLQSVVFRHAQHQAHPQHQPQTGGSEPEEVFDDHNKHIHMDTVMYEAPNKQRSALIAISSDSENTTSDDSDSESGSDSDSDSDEESNEDSDGSGSDEESDDGSDSDDGDIESENVHVIHDIHEVKHIEISMPTDNNNINELEIESVTIIDEASTEEPVAELPTETTEIKTVTVDLGTSTDTSSISTDTIDVLSLLNKNAISNEEHDVELDPHFTAPISASAAASFQGLSVIELRALLKEKYKGQPEKITNLQKLKKPELIQLLQE
jgi:hypothetical protein